MEDRKTGQFYFFLRCEIFNHRTCRLLRCGLPGNEVQISVWPGPRVCVIGDDKTLNLPLRVQYEYRMKVVNSDPEWIIVTFKPQKEFNYYPKRVFDF